MDTNGGDQQQYMEWDQLQEDYQEELTFSHEAVDMDDPSIAEDNNSDNSEELGVSNSNSTTEPGFYVSQTE